MHNRVFLSAPISLCVGARPKLCNLGLEPHEPSALGRVFDRMVLYSGYSTGLRTSEVLPRPGGMRKTYFDDIMRRVMSEVRVDGAYLNCINARVDIMH